ncbi:hypothetical protein HMPREF1257_02207 [Corynebacterium sp. KPL1814]|nr:hypothetical protein HMPREF1281_02073 [Corynebacterium sp. KPL1855]ERS60019.1 hypothetical protein HMPREF1257_02207 [Corynebacterium sp. KPL1814]ERS77919.1 hypothetical protein HMPREF1285_01795 [Corynebacterium sp. KPL1859]
MTAILTPLRALRPVIFLNNPVKTPKLLSLPFLNHRTSRRRKMVDRSLVHRRPKNPVLLLRMRLQRQAATSLQMLVRISPARRLPNRPQQVQSPRRRDTNLLLIRSPHPQTRQKITKGLQTMQGQAPDRARDNNHMRHRLEAGTTRSQVLNQIMVNPLRALRSLKAMGEQLVRISAGSVQL